MNKCLQWLSNSSINPYTGRTIKINGPTFKRLQLECSDSRDCEKWMKNSLINPVTGRVIKKDGPTFKILQRKCGSQAPIQRYNLEKFIKAQNKSYEKVISELKRGKKTSHWIWYIFPQLSGLGFSTTSKYYAISSLDEAVEYLHHPVLGERYLECVEILNNIRGKTIFDIFSTDDVKVHSSLTLFYFADPENETIKHALNKYFEGRLDAATERVL